MPRCSTIQRQIRLALGPLMVLDELCSDPIQRIMDFLQIRTISMRNDSKYRCRVCGFRSEDPPWGQDEQVTVTVHLTVPASLTVHLIRAVC